MNTNKYFFTFFLILFSIVNNYSQDFIATMENESIVMDQMLREKLMPYSLKTVKERGISKEFHISNNDTIRTFSYNSEGLLIQYEYLKTVYNSGETIKNPYHQNLIYDLNKNLVAVLMNEMKIVTIKRDKASKIIQIGGYRVYGTSDLHEYPKVTYKYNGNKLISVGELRRNGNKLMIKKKTGPGLRYPHNVEMDLYGRNLNSYVGEGGQIDSYDKLGRWTGYVNLGIAGEFTREIIYKDDLMYQITDGGWGTGGESTTVTIEYIYGYQEDRTKK